MFPRGIPSAALPVAVTSALRPVQLPRQPQVRLVITRILRPPHPARPAGRRNPPPPVPLRFTASRLAAHRPPKKLRAPACGIVFRASHHASGPRKIPAAVLQENASGASFVSSTSAARAATSERYGVKCCPRHSRHFRVRASLVQLGHSCGIT